MHLVKVEKDGSFTLTNDLIEDIPQYAILSHKWGSDNEELTFADVATGSGKEKLGYSKLAFCAEQARRDNLEYFWIDTCCIDRSNLTELSEAIVSMFSWYREAVKCYVYLNDVFISKTGDIETSWRTSFCNSRWFTRGWTLQELLAPKWVEFFSAQGLMLGDRNSLESLISEVTRIPIRALRGRSLTDYTFEERFTWVRDRKTRREEDKAYCLQGIFNVVMIPYYGEGYSRALRRLYGEIQKLADEDAPWMKDMPTRGKSPSRSGEMLGNNELLASSAVEEHDMAIEAARNALQRSHEQHGPNHSRTLTAVENLGTALEQIGDHEEAADQFRRALKGRELRRQQEFARKNLFRLANCLSILMKGDSVSPAVARRVSDLHIYTRPVGVLGSSYKHCRECAPLGFRVRVLRVWAGEDYIRGFQMDYSDGSSSPLKGANLGSVTEHIFEPGETISEIITYPDQGGSGVRAIEMETVRYEEGGNAVSTRVYFGVKEHGPVSHRRAETGIGLLVGMYGRVTLFNVHGIGFIFLSPTHTIAHKSILEFPNAEDETKGWSDCDLSQYPDLFITDGVGGSEGNPFQDIAEGRSSVRKILIWRNLYGALCGIQLAFDKDKTSVVRGLADGQPSVFEFHDSEFMIDLAMTISGYQRPQCFWFETNESRKFNTTTSDRSSWHIQQDLRPGGILVGMFGYCGDHLEWLGFIFR